jgi:pimeloyl-ACP methyl ester carboxylesterase
VERAATVESGFVPVSGGAIHYRIEGNGQPLVLLHGGRLDLSMWNALVPRLSAQRRVVRWDAPGHGASTAPQRPTAETADELLKLLDHLRIKRATLIGFSMGAGTASSFAIQHPQRVNALVLISTSGPPPGAPQPRTGAPPLSEEAGRRQLARTGLPVLMVVGSRDGDRIRATADAVAKDVPSASLLVIENAGHDVVRERGEEIAAAVLKFAAKVPIRR